MTAEMRWLRRCWWTHFGAGRHYWKDRYLEMLDFFLDAHDRAASKSLIIRKLRDEG